MEMRMEKLVRGDKVLFNPAFEEQAWIDYAGLEAEVLSVFNDEVEILFEDGTELGVIDFELIKK